MRVLLQPAFHPEVCVTINAHDGVLSVVTFDQVSFWHSLTNEFLTTWREEGRIAKSACEELVRLFQKTHSGLDPTRKYVCMDGMGVEACLVSADQQGSISGNVGANAGIHEFAKNMAQTSRAACSRPEVRNALSATLYYVGCGEPEKEGGSLPVVKMMVIGEDGEREKVLKAIQKKTGGAFRDGKD
jgi:hypothetical protein